MLICHCRRQSDREIRAAIRAGARSLTDVKRACGAASGCGGCGPAVEDLIDAERAKAPASLPMLRIQEEPLP